MQFTRARTRANEWVSSVERFFSEFSFTLCVPHIPLRAAFVQLSAPVAGNSKLDPNHTLHLLVNLPRYLELVLGAYLFHLPFEAKTN